ncbi:hypothetical protein [Nocardia sp. NBC_01009]|uniref:hypothetical protein n=1 Tax=Nocardia sp. NBC_01009 TaxID=2975996 RepID=UPI00386BD2E3|nr:hypothetical protein OHA42_27925 [Nocardia sp. NBC_01009]
MSNRANLVIEQTAELAMDYGQFLISGGAGRPSAPNDSTRVVHDLVSSASSSTVLSAGCSTNAITLRNNAS